jgi:chromosome segregation ATPase
VRLDLTKHNRNTAAMFQKIEQAEKEIDELRRKLQSTEKDLQGSQHELEKTKHAVEAAKSSLGAARLEQEPEANTNGTTIICGPGLRL